MAVETPPQSADSSRYIPSEVLKEVMNYELEPDWTVYYFFDFDEFSQAGIDSFSKEEMAAVRKLVIDRLKSEGLETRSYKLYTFDRAKAGVRPVYVLFDGEDKYIDEKSLDRTYFIRNNEIISERRK